MNKCSNCSQSSPASTKFCIHCGTAFAQPLPNSFAGRPVVSMDRRIPIQPPVSPSPNVQQPPISSVNQVQSTSINQVSPKKGFQGNKIIFGLVAAIVAIGALVLIGGRSDSDTPTVAPEGQQSGYSSYDDYPYEYRSSFMDSCTVDGLYDGCLCVLETLEQTYTMEELTYLSESGDSSYLEPVIQYCL